MNTANTEIDNSKTMSKTICATQSFLPRKYSMLKFEIILGKNRGLIIDCIEKNSSFHLGFFSRLLLQTQEGNFFSRWASSQD